MLLFLQFWFKFIKLWINVFSSCYPWRYSSEEPRPTEAVAARWQYRGPCGWQSTYPSTLISVFLTGFRCFSYQVATQYCPHETGWTPFQTLYFETIYLGASPPFRARTLDDIFETIWGMPSVQSSFVGRNIWDNMAYDQFMPPCWTTFWDITPCRISVTFHKDGFTHLESSWRFQELLIPDVEYSTLSSTWCAPAL